MGLWLLWYVGERGIGPDETLLVLNFCPDSPAAMFSVNLREGLV